MLSVLKLFTLLLAGTPLSADEERLVRDTVYQGKFAFASGPFSATNPVIVRHLMAAPELTELVGRKYFAVMGLMERIAEGGRPTDAATACALGIALTINAEVATVVQDHFNADEYDQVDRHWQYPPRQHWRRNLVRDKWRVNPYLVRYLKQALVW